MLISVVLLKLDFKEGEDYTLFGWHNADDSLDVGVGRKAPCPRAHVPEADAGRPACTAVGPALLLVRAHPPPVPLPPP